MGTHVSDEIGLKGASFMQLDLQLNLQIVQTQLTSKSISG